MKVTFRDLAKSFTYFITIASITSCMSYEALSGKPIIEYDSTNMEIQEFLERNQETIGAPNSLNIAFSNLAKKYGMPVKVYFKIDSYMKEGNVFIVKNRILNIYNILGVDWIVEVKDLTKATCIYNISHNYSHGSLYNRIVLTDIYNIEIIDNSTSIVIGKNTYSSSYFPSTTNPILPNGRNISSYIFYSKWE